ncbi:MAG: ABC transporter ATP-binding protein [Gemmatimonadaceae bacterium]
MRGDSPDDPLIEAHGLGRRFSGREVLRDVSLTIRGGECLALFGPNGAGKTTLLRVFAGLLTPSAGSARVAGVDVPAAGARAAVGLVSHASMLYEALTARENIEFSARLYAVREPRAATRLALERMRLLDSAELPVRELSRGLRQRVSIARATVHRPRAVLLDEPFTGLDDAGAASLTSWLTELRRDGAAVILVTHNLPEGLAQATHAAIMREGRVLRVEPRESLDQHRYVLAYGEHATRGA